MLWDWPVRITVLDDISRLNNGASVRYSVGLHWPLLPGRHSEPEIECRSEFVALRYSLSYLSSRPTIGPFVLLEPKRGKVALGNWLTNAWPEAENLGILREAASKKSFHWDS